MNSAESLARPRVVNDVDVCFTHPRPCLVELVL
jgi:hypothetical protein